MFRVGFVKSSTGIRTHSQFTRVRTKTEDEESSISILDHLTGPFPLKDMTPRAEQEPKESTELVRKPVQGNSKTYDTHTRCRHSLLTIPPEILDEILKWLSINDQQSVAWTSKILHQNYVPILQDSRQDFPPEAEEYPLLQRKPQTNKSCCPPEERIQGTGFDWWRVHHTESCTMKYANSVWLCPCLMLCPRSFSSIIYDLAENRGLILAHHNTSLAMVHTQDGPYIAHECTLTDIPDMEAQVLVHIVCLSEERLLISVEYRIHVWNVAQPEKPNTFYICPHDQDVMPWLRAYFDHQEKGIVGWQSVYELCPFCQIMVCRGKGLRDIVVRIRSGIYQDRMARYCISEYFPVLPFAVAANYPDQDRDALSQTAEEQLDNWEGTALC